MRYIFLALLVMLTSCSLVPQREVYLSEPLPLPERPLLPTVAASDWVELASEEIKKDVGGQDLTCLPTHKYIDLADRDAALRGHVERLERIIKSTWGDQ